MRAFVVFLVVLAAACGAAPVEPSLRFVDGTPDDLRELARATFADVLAAVPSHHGCLHDVSVSGAWELDDRARYDPATRRVTVRVPATAPNLEVSLVHELAHHLEFACPAQQDVRSAFLDAQGLPPDADWFSGPTWEATPSEQWASAVVLHVLDRRDTSARISIEPAALDVVGEWAHGR